MEITFNGQFIKMLLDCEDMKMNSAIVVMIVDVSPDFVQNPFVLLSFFYLF